MCSLKKMFKILTPGTYECVPNQYGCVKKRGIWTQTPLSWENRHRERAPCEGGGGAQKRRSPPEWGRERQGDASSQV